MNKNNLECKHGIKNINEARAQQKSYSYKFVQVTLKFEEIRN